MTLKTGKRQSPIFLILAKFTAFPFRYGMGTEQTVREGKRRRREKYRAIA